MHGVGNSRKLTMGNILACLFAECVGIILLNFWFAECLLVESLLLYVLVDLKSKVGQNVIQGELTTPPHLK